MNRQASKAIPLELSPEYSLLLRCARQRLSRADAIEIQSVLAKPLDWQAIIYNARWHKLSGLLYLHLHDEPFVNFMPPEVLVTLKADFARNTARYLYYRTELIAILRVLNGAAIPAIVLKGAALQSTVYDSPGIRPMADIDLLIPEDHLRHAYDLIRAMGYRPAEDETDAEHWANHQHLPTLVGVEKATSVEIHRHVVRKDSALAFDVNGFWTRAVNAEFDGVPAMVLAPEDFALHLSINFFRDRRFYSVAAISQLADIAELCRFHSNGASLDWAALARRAHQDGIDGPVACALTLASQLLEAPIPEDALKGFWGSETPYEELAAFASERVVTSREWVATEVVPATSEYGFRSLARSVLDRLFPSRAKMEHRYGNAGIWSYVRHIGKRLPVILRLLLRPWSIGEELTVDRWMHSLYRKPPTASDMTDD